LEVQSPEFKSQSHQNRKKKVWQRPGVVLCPVLSALEKLRQ
jgi:hypothetical protein